MPETPQYENQDLPLPKRPSAGAQMLLATLAALGTTGAGCAHLGLGQQAPTPEQCVRRADSTARFAQTAEVDLMAQADDRTCGNATAALHDGFFETNQGRDCLSRAEGNLEGTTAAINDLIATRRTLTNLAATIRKRCNGRPPAPRNADR